MCTFVHPERKSDWPFIILFGIFGGFSTTVESASMAVFYAPITTMHLYRTVTVAQLGPILVSAAVTSAAVVTISGVALSFSYIVAIQNIPELVLNVLHSVTANQADLFY